MRLQRSYLSLASQKLGNATYLGHQSNSDLASFSSTIVPQDSKPAHTKKQFSQPLNRPKHEEMHKSYADEPVTRAVERTLEKDFEEELKLAEKQGLGLDAELKIVRKTLLSLVRENPNFRSILTKVMVFYEETVARSLREADHCQKQLAKMMEDKAILEKTLQSFGEKTQSRSVFASPQNQVLQGKLETEIRSAEQKKGTTWISPPSQNAKEKEPDHKAEKPVRRKRPEETVSHSVKPSEKPFTRPRSVPKLNLEVLSQNRPSHVGTKNYLEDRQSQQAIYIEEL